MGRLMVALIAVLAGVSPAAGEYPDRPVRAIVGYPAGGLADVTLRALAEGMKKKFPKGLAVVKSAGGGRLDRRQ